MKTEKKSMSALKKLTILFAIILTVFALINLSWYLLKYRPYKELTEGFQPSKTMEEIDNKHYEMEKDGYYFMVKMPGYLGYEGGFCRITTMMEFSDDSTPENESGKEENSSVLGYTFYYWPQIWGDDYYGIDIETGDNFIQLSITKDLEYVPNDHESKAEIQDHKKLIEENKEEIVAIMKEANQVWGV